MSIKGKDAERKAAEVFEATRRAVGDGRKPAAAPLAEGLEDFGLTRAEYDRLASGDRAFADSAARYLHGYTAAATFRASLNDARARRTERYERLCGLFGTNAKQLAPVFVTAGLSVRDAADMLLEAAAGCEAPLTPAQIESVRCQLAARRFWEDRKA